MGPGERGGPALDPPHLPAGACRLNARSGKIGVRGSSVFGRFGFYLRIADLLPSVPLYTPRSGS